MEELKCSLLGFDAGALTHACHRSDDDDDDNASRHAQAATLRLHAAEAALLARALALGRAYRVLHDLVLRVATGAVTSMYTTALATGVQRLLRRYDEAVSTLTTPSSLLLLCNAFEVTFAQLSCIVAAHDATASVTATTTTTTTTTRTRARIDAIERFLSDVGIAHEFRSIVGEAVWLSLLYTTAHYVAHGVILHGCSDYFISIRKTTAATTTTTTAGDAGSSKARANSNSRPVVATTTAAAASVEAHVLDVDLLPSAVPLSLAKAILAAGRARRLLFLRDTAHATLSSRRGSVDDNDDDNDDDDDYLQAIASSVCEPAALAVFDTIYTPALCVGGVLAAHELEARVTAATRQWSHALWRAIGEGAALQQRLRVWHAMYLCQRGDVWATFVDGSFDAIVRVYAEGNDTSSSNNSTRPRARARRRCATSTSQRRVLQRAVTRALSSALVACIVHVNDSATTTTDERSDGTTYDDFCIVLDDDEDNDDDDDDGDGDGDDDDDDANAFARVASGVWWTLRRMRLRFRGALPASLALVVSYKALAYYQRLHTFLLCMRYANYALQQVRQALAAVIVTNAHASTDLRRAYALYQLMQSMLSAVCSYVQVDVLAPHLATLHAQLQPPQQQSQQQPQPQQQSSASACVEPCRSVDDAKRQHDRFVWHVAGGCFVCNDSNDSSGDNDNNYKSDDTAALHRACVSLMRGALLLYAVCCTRVRVSSWAVQGVNDTPPAVAAALTALTTRLQRDVLATFALQLGSASAAAATAAMTTTLGSGSVLLSSSSREGAARALWTWLDMNGYLSQRRYRHLASPALLQPITLAVPQQQQQQQQQHAPLPRPSSSSSSQPPRTLLTSVALGTPPPPQPPSLSSSQQQQQQQQQQAVHRRHSTAGTTPTSTTRIPRLRHASDADATAGAAAAAAAADDHAHTVARASNSSSSSGNVTTPRRASSRPATRRQAHGEATATSSERLR